MRVLHLASYDEWTGAAAIALEETVALRAAGVEAHLAYMGGGELESKLGDREYAHPILSKNQDPVSVMRSVRGIRRLHGDIEFDVLHAHLSHDHWLALAARPGSPETTLCRTFHAARALRDDGLTRRMIGWTDGIAVSNCSLTELAPLRGLVAAFLPPAIDVERFHSNGVSARSNYLVPNECRLLGAIGKIDANRGFEDVIETFSLIAERNPRCQLMMIGDGELKDTLIRDIAERGLSNRVTWAGFRDQDLPEHYRAIDLLLYVAPGSEEGHRAVIEALACGTPVAAFGVPGLEAVLSDLAGELVVEEKSPRALGDRAQSLLDAKSESLSSRCVERATEFSRPVAAGRLIDFYEAARQGRRKSLRFDLR